MRRRSVGRVVGFGGRRPIAGLEKDMLRASVLVECDSIILSGQKESNTEVLWVGGCPNTVWPVADRVT